MIVSTFTGASPVFLTNTSYSTVCGGVLPDSLPVTNKAPSKPLLLDHFKALRRFQFDFDLVGFLLFLWFPSTTATFVNVPAFV